MSLRIVAISMDADDLRRIDRAVALLGTNRSAFVRDAALRAVQEASEVAVKTLDVRVVAYTAEVDR